MTPAGLQSLAQMLGEAADYAASCRGRAAAERLLDAAHVLQSIAEEERKLIAS